LSVWYTVLPLVSLSYLGEISDLGHLNETASDSLFLLFSEVPIFRKIVLKPSACNFIKIAQILRTFMDTTDKLKITMTISKNLEHLIMYT